MNGGTGGWMNRQMAGWMNILLNEEKDGWMDGWMDGGTGGWNNE